MDYGLSRAQEQYDNQLPDEEIIFNICDVCGEEIYVGDEYYDIDGIIIHDECLKDWAKEYKKEAE